MSSWYVIRYIDQYGFRQNNSLKADSKQHIHRYISSQCFTLISLRKMYVIEHWFKKVLDHRLIQRLIQPSLRREQVYWLTKELHGFVSSGMPLHQALIAIRDFNSSKKYQFILNSIITDIELGLTLSMAFSRFPRTFPSFYLICIQSGEKVGCLNESLLMNATIIQWLNTNRSTIIQATFLPLFSLFFIIGSFIFSLRFLVPFFLTILDRLHAEVPLITQILATFNVFLDDHGIFLLHGFNASMIIVVLFISNKYTGYYFERFIVKVPIYGRFYIYFASSFLSKILSLLIKQKYPLIHAFELSKKLFNGPLFQREMEMITVKLSNGHSLGQAFDGSHLFEPLMTQLIRDGERSGNIVEKIDMISEIYRIKLQNKTDWILKSITPISLMLTLLFTALFMVAFFLPLWQVYF